ncbi:uncharacterized protein LOC132551201 [Ylistrum balloti]|uniref:uncharacterized protein LOC132551201 n=1 Tax=Ylistrum balloti TaxID=509963 RepID=UPI002905B79D|nr:uncharacterized protein LOC132551201 [Ylistrum balloti]
MGIVTSCERNRISLYNWQATPCSNKSSTSFKILGERRVKLKGVPDITNTDFFLRNPYEKDADRYYLAHLIPDNTDVATLPPNRFPVPAGVDLPSVYPLWLGNYINNKDGMRLKLELSSLSMPEAYIEKVSEAHHLRHRLHYLSLTYIHEVDETRPRFLLWEVYKGRRERGVRVQRRRHLYPRIVMLRKTETFIIIGKGFMLRLYPVPEVTDPDQYGALKNNGELPVSLGTYTRILDSIPSMSMDWNVRLWAWENGRHS